MLNYIVNGEIFIKMVPAETKKYEPTSIGKATAIYSSEANHKYLLSNPEDIKKLPEELLERLENQGLMTSEMEYIYNNRGFYQAFNFEQGTFMVNKKGHNLNVYKSANSIEEYYLSLEEFLARSLYIGRIFKSDNPKLPEYILLYTAYGTHILKDTKANSYTVLSVKDPNLRGYIIGDLVPEYYDKENVYQAIIAQELHQKDETELKL